MEKKKTKNKRDFEKVREDPAPDLQSYSPRVGAAGAARVTRAAASGRGPSTDPFANRLLTGVGLDLR
jgi:hypothetical protein